MDSFTEFVWIWVEGKNLFWQVGVIVEAVLGLKKKIPRIRCLFCRIWSLRQFLHMILLKITWIFTSHSKITAIHFLGQTLPPSWSVLSSSLLHRKDKCSKRKWCWYWQLFTLKHLGVPEWDICGFPLVISCAGSFSDTEQFQHASLTVHCGISPAGIQHRPETADNQKEEMQQEK